MGIFFEGVLKNEECGFVGLTEAVINLLENQAGDKPASELNSEKLIEQDMAAFFKAGRNHRNR